MKKNHSKGNGAKNDHLKVIRTVIQQIVETFHPQKIVLFGSYAYGWPRRDSDVDLLVVMKSHKRPVDRTVEILKSLRIYPFPMDLLVRTPEEIRRRLRMGDFFFEEILRKGKVLYER